jgi:hypothetical protein
MQFVDGIPDGEVLCALEPEELGLRILPLLTQWPETHRSVPLTLENVIVLVSGDHRGYGNWRVRSYVQASTLGASSPRGCLRRRNLDRWHFRSYMNCWV